MGVGFQHRAGQSRPVGSLFFPRLIAVLEIDAIGFLLNQGMGPQTIFLFFIRKQTFSYFVLGVDGY